MAITSLRQRIFLLTATILALVAACVMVVTEQSVTQSSYQSEARAAGHVLRLMRLNTETRHRQLLREKTATVRLYREQLDEQAATIQTTLQQFVNLAEQGSLTQDEARQAALQWVRALADDPDGLDLIVFDNQLDVLAHSGAARTDPDLQTLRDLKGEAVALDTTALAAGRSRTAVYPWPRPGDRANTTRFGHFSRLAVWDWNLLLSVDASRIEDQLRAQRAHLLQALATVLDQTVLAREGFVTLLRADGSFVVPLTARQREPLGAYADSLAQHLAPLDGQAQGSVTLAGQPWEVQQLDIKPLHWRIVALIPRADILQPAHSLLLQQAAIFLLMLAVALGIAWFYANRLVRPLDQLTRYAHDLPTRDLLHGDAVPADIARLPVQYHDEVGRLASTVLGMETRLRDNVLDLMRETSSRERIESELSIARDIQLGLLPVPLPDMPEHPVDLAARMQPAKEVGGDLYDYFLLPDGRLCFAIGDVAGKGVPAALFMAITRTLLRSAAQQACAAEQLMQAVNDRLSEHNPNLMFVTLLIGVLDLDDGSLTYANAGHPPPLVLGANGVRPLPGRSGPACGVATGITYTAHEAVLAPGEILLGYTDGVNEAETATGEQYGMPRLLAWLDAQPWPNAGCSVLAQSLLDTLTDFCTGAEPADDITLIAVRRPTAAENS